MKKLQSTLLISTAVFGGAQIVAAQDVIGAGEADIAVNGTLGANNTDPGSTIHEGDTDWINVTVPTETIFYNKATDATIKAPTYDITNNSGRPVTVSVKSFTDATSVTNPALPKDFALNLNVSGQKVTTASTSLVKDGTLQTTTNQLITLSNNVGQYVKGDVAVGKDTSANSKATFTYGGTATATDPIKLSYTLSLKFDSVAF